MTLYEPNASRLDDGSLVTSLAWGGAAGGVSLALFGSALLSALLALAAFAATLRPEGQRDLELTEEEM